MKLFKVWQNKNNEYDTYDSAIVAAEDEQAAKMTHPSKENWSGKCDSYDSWCDVKYVKVEYIGEAKAGTEAGVICASFNAG